MLQVTFVLYKYCCTGTFCSTGTFYVAGTSDISSVATPQPLISASMANTIVALHRQAVQLRTDISALRSLHLSSVQSANAKLDEIYDKAKVFWGRWFRVTHSHVFFSFVFVNSPLIVAAVNGFRRLPMKIFLHLLYLLCCCFASEIRQENTTEHCVRSRCPHRVAVCNSLGVHDTSAKVNVTLTARAFICTDCCCLNMEDDKRSRLPEEDSQCLVLSRM